MIKKDIKSLTLNELRAEMENIGEKSFKANQIYSWLHKRGAESFDKMTDISKKLRENLENSYDIYNCSIEKKLVSMYDSTVKYLFRLHDGELIESVVMKYKYGYTI